MIRDQELAGLAMTLGRDANIKVTVSGDNSYCSADGSTINIARMPATPLGRMLMTGLIFHEIGHKNYTTGGKPSGLLGDMMNVIEDIRVEMETIQARPGTSYNLDAITTYYSKNGTLEPQDLTHALLGKAMSYGRVNVLNQKALLYVESACNEMMDDAFGQGFIDDAEAILKEIPNLTSTSETETMAEQLIDLLIQQKNPPPPKLRQDSKIDEEPSGSGLKSGGGQKGKEKNKQKDENDDGGQQVSGCQNDRDGVQDQSASSKLDSQSKQDKKKDENRVNNQKSSSSGGNLAGSGAGNRPTSEEIEEMLKQETGYGDLSQLIQDEMDKIAMKTPKSIKESIPCLPKLGIMLPENGKLDEVEALSTASRMRAKLMGMLQSIKRQPKSFGCSGKKLATNRLVKMAGGDPKIFKKKIEAVKTNTAVSVLLDLSGSMGGKALMANGVESSLYHVANKAAFALHHTLFGIRGVAVCSCEFSGKGAAEAGVNILTDFGQKPLSENFNQYPRGGTPTDDAIWAGRAMLLQRPEPRKVMLVLTDGDPSDPAKTVAATSRALSDGIEIAAIGIMHKGVEHFWENNRIIKNLQELPAAMFAVMENLLTQKK